MKEFLLRLLDLCVMPYQITDNLIVMIPAISCAVIGVTGLVKMLLFRGQKL